MTITQLTIEEVRCFAECQQFAIRPLTFLVGENSTGKTTALACFHVLAHFLEKGMVDFNLPPYAMGIFREIVRRSRRPEKTFSLGFSLEEEAEPINCIVQFCQKKGGFEPAVKSVSLQFSDGEILLEMHDELERMITYGPYCGERNRHRIHVRPDFLEGLPVFAFLRILPLPVEADDPEERELLANYLSKKSERMQRLFEWPIGMDAISVYSAAPVRSKPKRTYDPIGEFDDPEGSDAPMYLMRLAATKKDEWEDLKERLDRFGTESGLFQSIDIKNLGRSRGDPFQLNVKVRGPRANMIDVGYGVSQVLPLLVRILGDSGSPRRVYERRGPEFVLLQQPEVHLHPRAQAEFSSLLAHVARRGGQSFLVETHSDYMVDRARIEIRRGNIKNEDVSLIYLEPKGNVVHTHNITFDEMGNMIGVLPPHFREFFLLESDRLMGFKE